MFTASGTGAFESAYANLLSPGDRVLCVTAGQLRRSLDRDRAGLRGRRRRRCAFELGERPDVDRVVAAVEADPALSLDRRRAQRDLDRGDRRHPARSPSARAAATRCSWSTPSRASAPPPLETDAWGLDVVVTGSQKALMCPPGLAFASVSPRAWERAERATSPRFYFDWKRTRKAQIARPAEPVHAGDPARARRSTPRSTCCSRTASRPRGQRTRGARRDGPRTRARDGSRAVLARRPVVLARDGDLGARRRRRRRACAAPSRVATASSWPAGRDRSSARSGASASSARSRHATSAPGWTRSRSSSRPHDAAHPRRRAHRAGRSRAAAPPPATSIDGTTLDRAGLLDAVADADALVVRSATQVDAELIARADQLRVIGRAGVGVDNVDVAAATRRGILVCNAPQSNIVSAAEHTIALLLAVARNVPAGARRARRGPLGALALRRRRARRQDARRARLRPHRPARRRTRARPRHAHPGLRPARDARALPRARRRVGRVGRGGLRVVRLHHAAPAADRRDAPPDLARRALAHAPGRSR